MESIIRPFLEHPHRKWIVIIGTFVLLLVVVWPLADDYFAMRHQRSSLLAGLDDARETVGRRALYHRRLEEKRLELAELEQRSLPEEAMFEFRGQVADWAREAGCQVRRMRMGQPRLRRWREEDHPLSNRSGTEAGRETPFELRTQPFSVSVAGPTRNVKVFLEKINQSRRLMHTENVAARPLATDPTQMELDLELLLFDLPRVAGNQ